MSVNDMLLGDLYMAITDAVKNALSEAEALAVTREEVRAVRAAGNALLAFLVGQQAEAAPMPT